MVYEHGDWRWEASIGLWYGYYKGQIVTAVAMPLMTSVWWTLAADDHADFVRIFPSAHAAITAAEQEIATVGVAN